MCTWNPVVIHTQESPMVWGVLGMSDRPYENHLEESVGESPCNPTRVTDSDRGSRSRTQ